MGIGLGRLLVLVLGIDLGRLAELVLVLKKLVLLVSGINIGHRYDSSVLKSVL